MKVNLNTQTYKRTRNYRYGSCGWSWKKIADIYGNSRIDPYLFEAAGEYLDYISAHQYWIENWQEHSRPNYLSCMMLSEKPELYIKNIISQIQTAEKKGQINEGQIKIA